MVLSDSGGRRCFGRAVTRKLKIAGILGALGLFLMGAWSGNAGAFYISETKEFHEGPYTFKIEIQVYGRGSPKRNPMRITSVKVKIKNEKASSDVLRVVGIRAFPASDTRRDIDNLGYAISPAQWVTKFYRLPKERQPLFSRDGFFQVEFEKFAIRFSPRDRRFEAGGIAFQK